MEQKKYEAKYSLLADFTTLIMIHGAARQITKKEVGPPVLTNSLFRILCTCIAIETSHPETPFRIHYRPLERPGPLSLPRCSRLAGTMMHQWLVIVE